MKKFVIIMVALFLLLVGTVVAVTAAQSKDYSARSQAALDFDIGLNDPDVQESLDRVQEKIDAWTSSHHLDAEGNIVPNTPEPITDSPVSIIFSYQYQFNFDTPEPATP